MTSPSDILRQLTNPASFFSLFEARLKVLNATYGVHLTSGIEVDYVQMQWADMCRDKAAALGDDVCRIFAQDILGELCNGLTRFDSVVMAGNHHAAPGNEEEELIRDFIGKHPRGYVAVDFCSDVYRQIMPFSADMYRSTKKEVLEACMVIDGDPIQGRNFVRLLKYPDKLKIVH